MPGNFTSPDGDLENLYLTDYNFIDRYVTTGTLWGWGYNANGWLGTNDRTNRSTPVQTVSAGTSWRQVSAHQNGATAAIKTDGTLWCWGGQVITTATRGEIGDNTTSMRSSPVQTVAGGTNWRQCSSGGYHTLAVKTDGTLWLWGDNTDGQMGNNVSGTKYSSPIQTVSGGNNWKQCGAGYGTSFAIKTDGTLWCWGRGTSGQLGDGTTVSKSSPVQTVAGGTNWSTVKSYWVTAGALKTDGTLWMWGANSNGNLGTNDRTSRSSPTQVVGNSTWIDFASASNFTLGIKTDGTLWGWGTNSQGWLGDGTIVNKSTPVQTIAGGTNWKKCAAGAQIAGAIKTDGTLWMWGDNTYGQTGINTSGSPAFSSPVMTGTGNNWKSIALGAGAHAVFFYDANNLYPK